MYLGFTFRELIMKIELFLDEKDFQELISKNRRDNLNGAFLTNLTLSLHLQPENALEGSQCHGFQWTPQWACSWGIT